MDYCGPRGIPLSTFLQWPVDDQAAALGWQAEDRQRCPNCGTAEWEWEENPNAYVTEERVCRGCHRRGAAEKDIRKRDEDMPGLYVRLMRPESEGGDDGRS